jgi:protein-tyrosine phosphatase
MSFQNDFVDIHCHLLPGIDDGSADLATSLGMARMASDDGTRVIIATPHQLGAYEHNRGDAIRALVRETQAAIQREGIALTVLPGADVRIESNMIEGLRNGNVLTLGDLEKHVLLELPHELYFCIEGVLRQLTALGMQGVLSHPERNAGLLARQSLVEELVDIGCLMQVTAGSLMGTFGSASQRMAEMMLSEGLVHFLATDAHGEKSRRPLMHRAFVRACELVGEQAAAKICCENPARIAQGEPVDPGRMTASQPKRRSRWFARATA